jgi:periplasmic divalent cation tolerance protein
VTAAEAVVVLVTTGGQEEAETLSRSLLDDRLCACVTIVPQTTSIFRWQGSIDVARESLLVIKTTREALPALVEGVRRRHHYQVPEILAIPVIGGSPEYLDWLTAETKPRPGGAAER